MTTLLAQGRGRTQRGAATLGASWGLGHATALFACGVPIVLFKAYLPEGVQRGAETAVGFIIISLAVALLLRWRRVHASERSHAHERPVAARTPLQAYGIGLVHDIGGSAGVGLLLLASIRNDAYALIGLALFAAFTAVSMTLLSGLLGLTLAKPRHRRSLARLAPILGVASLSFGIWYSLSAMQVVA